MRGVAACLAIALVAQTASAAAAPSMIQVSRAWVRPAPAGAVTAGYFTLANRGGLADRLTGASSPIAEHVGLHESRAIGRVMTMRPLTSVTLAGRASVAFAPGGRHLMIERLRRPLRVGQIAPVTLDFDRAGRVTAWFQVRATPP